MPEMNDSDLYLVKTFEIFEIGKVEKSYEHLETAEKNEISEEKSQVPPNRQLKKNILIWTIPPWLSTDF